MKNYIEFLLNKIKIPDFLHSYMLILISLLLLVIIGIIIRFAANHLVFKTIRKIISKTVYKWDDILFDKIFFKRLGTLVPFVVSYFILDLFIENNSAPFNVIRKLITICLIFFSTRIINTLIHNFNSLYQNFKIAKKTSIKGYIQLIQIFLYMLATILSVSVLINKDPWILLSGFGAMTAVLLLIFKDSILGLVASVQISANDMVRIGDWIEIPVYQADGDVIEMSLTTIKVKNWDNTITAVPIYSLVSGSFKNWRGMSESGGRRIKRSIFIDINSIRFLDQELIDRLGKIKLLENYLKKQQIDIDNFNKSIETDGNDLLNGRHMTNIGTFRAYAQLYIEKHPNFNSDMTSLVRQLESGPNGLPIEIYFFTNDTAWLKYETIQSDIFDHLFAILPYFELRVFQQPTGFDMKNIGSTNNNDLNTVAPTKPWHN